MASESPSLSQSLLTIKDEFEGLEVQEFDANALWELLSDEPGEEAEIGGDEPMQAMEVVTGAYPDLVVESYGCLEGINTVDENVHDFDWLHVMEETCNDIEGWYAGTCMEDMNDILAMRDYSFAQSAIVSDEIGYIGLWQDN